MKWLDILQLSTALLTQALQAFAAGHLKEGSATVQLTPEDTAVVQQLAAPEPEP